MPYFPSDRSKMVASARAVLPHALAVDDQQEYAHAGPRERFGRDCGRPLPEQRRDQAGRWLLLGQEKRASCPAVGDFRRSGMAQAGTCSCGVLVVAALTE
jgi:hypothetical protein